MEEVRSLEPHAVEVSPETWVLPNRVLFPAWVAETFRYDPSKTDVHGLYVHQRFVRDYLQSASPYRGLLLYHGLGVGKTCASIAISDVLRKPGSGGRVFIMLPAFLRGNFIEEVKKCGDPRFRPDQPWTRSVTHARTTFLAAPEGGTPFAEFSPQDRDLIRAQIDRDIIANYTIVHYNGLNTKSLATLNQGETNPFDDAVVIIDEAPNVIGQVMHNKMMALVYQRIMDADRCKVVLLSGTPLVNAPRELAYITNLTHGYIRELLFSGIPPGVDLPALEEALRSSPYVDHVSSVILVDGARVIATLVPGGFTRVTDGFKVMASDDSPRPAALSAMLHQQAAAAAGVSLRAPTLHDRFLLPIDSDTFASAFLSVATKADTPITVLNTEVLARRLLGTVSVYSSTDPALMPTILPAKVIRMPMSDLQYEEYLIQRDIERRKERAAARFAAINGNEDTKNLYRAFSRAVCTFVFPEGIKRPYRSDVAKARGAGGGEEEEDDGGDQDIDQDHKAAKRKVDRAYDERLNAALALIDADRVRLLGVAGQLSILSPKYGAILAHLLEPANARRPAIIYSQFRRAEGLGLLQIALIANGFAELKISMKRGALTAEVFPVDAKRDAPRFIVYGNDDVDSATAMLKVFNSKLQELPVALSLSLKTLVDIPEEGNLHGGLARILLITQSGSEGISTQNVREVHVIEPFWHANRILQVVGRAARANSHKDLPPDERTVDVFVYAATFTLSQASNTTITKLDKKRTSDEHILVVATQKRIVLDRFTDVLRRAAVDCVLHHPRSAARRCFVHPEASLKKGDGALSFHTDLGLDIATQGRNVHLVPFELEDGRPGMADPVTGDVYDKGTYAASGRLHRVAQRRPSSVVARIKGSMRERAAQ